MDLASVTVDRAQLDGLVGAVRAVTKNQQDAEDAVQDAWIVLHEKAARLDDGPVGGYWMRTARFKGMHIRDRKKAVSLDALVEIAGDSVRALSDGAFSLEARGELAELAADPVGKQILHSTAHGGAPQLAPRGENHQCAVYSDDQVRRVRELRTANLTCRQIEEITGVPRGYVPMLARRQCRVTGTTEGWSRQRILEAIRRFSARHGHAPTYRTADPLLPSPNTVRRYFGSWRAACHEAGCASSYDGRRLQPWTNEEIVRAFCELRLELGRWPSRLEIQQHAFPSVPSLCTLRRRFGSTSRRALVEAVTGGLAS